jgi:hypothetical protein
MADQGVYGVLGGFGVGGTYDGLLADEIEHS